MIRLQTNIFKGCATSRCMTWSTRSTAFIIALAFFAIAPRLALSGAAFSTTTGRPRPLPSRPPRRTSRAEPQAPPRLPRPARAAG